MMYPGSLAALLTSSLVMSRFFTSCDLLPSASAISLNVLQAPSPSHLLHQPPSLCTATPLLVHQRSVDSSQTLRLSLSEKYNKPSSVPGPHPPMAKLPSRNRQDTTPLPDTTPNLRHNGQ